VQHDLRSAHAKKTSHPLPEFTHLPWVPVIQIMARTPPKPSPTLPQALAKPQATLSQFSCHLTHTNIWSGNERLSQLQASCIERLGLFTRTSRAYALPLTPNNKPGNHSSRAQGCLGPSPEQRIPQQVRRGPEVCRRLAWQWPRGIVSTLHTRSQKTWKLCSSCEGCRHPAC
jgi:hypothetical protein